ncbi:amidase [Devosia sp.]|uniref:amidase n=1 Tax=Devosia sp. TaxID=1871048 RepID=UPI0037C05888
MDAKAPMPRQATDTLHYLSLTEVSGLIRSGAVSPVEVTQALLERIDALDGALKSYISVLPEHALASARRAEAELAAGIWRGPLHGVPIAVKDLCNTTYAPTGAGTYIHRDYIAPANATVVDRLEAGGAVMLGKLTLTEGAMSGHHPLLKTPVNPWNKDAWTGASSSGSGVATAAGLCYGSLGSDTGGSIRLPSTSCGLVGVKPTWGRVSRAGVWALADSLDHVGPMTRTVADAAAMLGVIAGHDPRDTTSLEASVPDYLAGLGGSIAGLRIGIAVAEDYIFSKTSDPVAAMMRETIATFVALGARLVPVAFPELDGLADYWMKICCAECAAAHKATFPSQRDAYGPALKGYLDLGHKVTALEVAEAMQYRLKLNGAVRRAMLDCDMLLVPGLPDPVADATFWDGTLSPEAIEGMVRFTAVFDMTGQPTLSINGGFDARGLPMGFQLVGPHLSEAQLFKAGHAFQSVTDWHTRHPVLPN